MQKAAEKHQKEARRHIAGFMGMCLFMGGVGGVVGGILTTLDNPERSAKPKSKP